MGKSKEKSRKRSPSFSSSSSSQDEGEKRSRKRHRMDHEGEKRSRKSEKKDKRKDKKSSKHRSNKEKKLKDKHKGKRHKGDYVRNIQELSNDDYFSKNNEFATWLKEEKKVFFSDLSSESAREMFSDFIKDWNNEKLDSRYYEGISSGPRSAHNWSFKK